MVQQIQSSQLTVSLIRGSISWDLPESFQFTPGETISITATITNPTDEMRMYVLLWSMIQNGALVSAGLVEIEDVEDWFVDGGESQEISFDLTPTITDAYLSISLLGGITEEEMEEDIVEEIIDSLTTYLYSTVTPIVQPLEITAQSLTTIMGVIMAVWTGVFVLSQVIKVFKGEEVEKPPLVRVTEGMEK